MNAPTRLGVFAVALAASLGVGLAVGAAVGPVDDDDAPTPHEVDHDAPVTSAAATSGDASDTAPSTAAVTPSSPSTTPRASTSTSAVDHSQMDHPTTPTVTP